MADEEPDRGVRIWGVKIQGTKQGAAKDTRSCKAGTRAKKIEARDGQSRTKLVGLSRVSLKAPNASI